MKLKRRSFLQSTGALLPAAMATRLVAQNVRQENRRAAEQTVDHYLADVSEVFKTARTAPTLRDPTGKVVRVVDPLSLRNSVAEASPHTTILLANGRYPMDELLVTCDGLSIRGESGNREAVVLDGQGKFTKVIRIRGASDVTIADLTVANSRQYGIFFLGDSDVQRLKVYNVKFHNCYTRGLKGTDATRINDNSRQRYPLEKAEQIRPAAGEVRYCLFVNDEINPNLKPFQGDYISGMDMMWLKNWVIADNVFVNILGQRGGGRGAIFVWVNSENVVAERNLIVNCDRGICFGNPSGGPAHMKGGIVRNNFIVTGRSQGIEVCQATGTAVLNNTVYSHQKGPLAVQFHKNGPGNRFINNLVAGPVEVPPEVNAENNLLSARHHWFVSPQTGNLHLTKQASGATGKGVQLKEVSDDFDGQLREGPIDLGADQVGHP
jgi:hypothetical protein